MVISYSLAAVFQFNLMTLVFAVLEFLMQICYHKQVQFQAVPVLCIMDIYMVK